MEKFDVIIIGSGPGGYVCAIKAAQNGLKVACVEARKTLGGTCLNVGCIPSKSLLQASEEYQHATSGDLANHGVEFASVKLNLKKMLQHKDGVVDKITKGVEFLFKKNKVTWLQGLATFTDSKTIQVADEFYQADKFVIATGSVPTQIKIAQFDHKFIVDSTDALEFKKVPKELVVLGAGVIGLELGSCWQRLGANVTIVEAGPRILPMMDKDVAMVLQKYLQKKGVKFVVNAMVNKTETSKSGVAISYEENGKTQTIKGDKLLVSVGRSPNTAKLGLDKAGVALDERGFVKTQNNYETSVANIYAIGDVIGGAMLAHKAEDEGIALADKLANKYSHINYDLIPSVIYTWPEIASVGISEDEAKKQNIAVKVGKFPFSANGRALALGMTEGFVKIISDPNSDKILGTHIVGPYASELIAEVVLAMEYSASSEDIARTCHAHPSLSEVVKEAAIGVTGKYLHK